MSFSAIKRQTAETLLAGADAPSGEAPWAVEARADARARLLDMGGPIKRDEYWRYTNPAALTAAAALAPLAKAAPGEDALRKTAPFAAIDALRIVFVNGRLRRDLSDSFELAGVEIEPLSNALAHDIHWVREVFGMLEKTGQTPVPRPLAALNTAVAGDGVAIRVTGAAARPIHLRYEQVGAQDAGFIRTVIKVEAGAVLTLLESGSGAQVLNTATEAVIDNSAALRHVRAQVEKDDNLAVSHIFARLETEALFKSFTLSTDGALTRNEIVMEMAGDDGVGHVSGGGLGAGDAVIDDTVFVIHAGQRCESRQVFKKVLDDKARGVFQGKIFVCRDAQKTDGYQISQSVLLSDEAEFDAKPELEIYADDVQCSHGSTTGALDETALFYLRSRGAPKMLAQAMLIAAFLDEVILEIDDEDLADEMRRLVEVWMARRHLAD